MFIFFWRDTSHNFLLKNIVREFSALNTTMEKVSNPGIYQPTRSAYKVKRGFLITQYNNMSTNGCTSEICQLNPIPAPIQQIKSPYSCPSVNNCVTLMIKTRYRLTCVVDLIKSFHSIYPGTKVIVADEIYDNNAKVVYPKVWRDLLAESPHGLITYIQTTRGND